MNDVLSEYPNKKFTLSEGKKQNKNRTYKTYNWVSMEF